MDLSSLLEKKCCFLLKEQKYEYENPVEENI